jgi:hypothetical protein
MSKTLELISNLSNLGHHRAQRAAFFVQAHLPNEVPVGLVLVTQVV